MVLELYKRFRPKSLEAVVGNEETVASLQSMIKKKSLPHTILFHGPSGCGKTTLGRILRRELECGLLDFREYNMSDFRGIDTIRDISRVMTSAPAGGKCRIFLLDEVHQLTKDGQSAALKILEDTPRHVYFILCTTEPQKLIETVRKRCCPLPVELLTPDLMLKLLKRVTKKAELDVSTDHLEDIAGVAEGSARTALVLLDKVSHLPPKARSKAIQSRLDEQTEVIQLCQALFKRESWATVCRILKTLKEQEPEQLRWAVLGYASAILGSGKQNEQAYLMIRCFEHHWYDSKRAGLIRACYETVSNA